jgi:predicted RNA-binding protein associated with RNAse of E/G family
MVLGVIVLLIEMRRESNDAFHQGWQKVNKVKKQLENQQFPEEKREITSTAP